MMLAIKHAIKHMTQLQLPRRRANGFTVIELLIIIVLIGIVATISVVAYRGVNERSVNTQLISDLTKAADQVELDYLSNKQYPEVASEANSNKGLATSPGTELTYISSTDNQWFCIEASSSKEGTKNYYFEQDGTATEGICPDAPLPANPTIVINQPNVPVISVTTSGANTTWSWPASTCNIGTPKYEYIYKNNAVTNAAVQTTATSHVVDTSTPINATHTVSVRAKCESGAESSTWSGYGSGSYTRPPTPPPAAPSTPVVSVSTSGATSTWSWPAVTCASGSPVYNYAYSNSGAGGSWTAMTGTSVFFNTATQGYVYTVAVRARCESGAVASDWSGTGSASYTRPVTDTVQIGSGSSGLYVPDKTANAIHGRANITGVTGGCGSGTRAITRYRTSVNNNWVDRGSWMIYGSGMWVTHSYDLDYDDLLEFSFYAVCQNPTTGALGSQTYADLYGNLWVAENRYKPTRGKWSRGCEIGHNSTNPAGPWCITDGPTTFAAF